MKKNILIIATTLLTAFIISCQGPLVNSSEDKLMNENLSRVSRLVLTSSGLENIKIIPVKCWPDLNQNPSKVLDVKYESQEDQAPINIYDYIPYHPAQTFDLVPAGSGYYYIHCTHSGKVFDVEYDSYDNGARIIQYTMVSPPSYAQQFEFVQVGNAFKIKPRHSGKALDLAEGNTNNQTPILQWADEDCIEQLFYLAQEQ